MKTPMIRLPLLLLLLLHGLIFSLLTACISAGRSIPAPVEDRVKSKPVATPKAPEKSAIDAKTVSATTASETAPKSDFYIVKQGDTLIRIGLDHGQNWRDVMRWNAIDNPNVIEVGQVLRVAPPANEAGKEEVVVNPVAPQAKVVPAGSESKAAVASPTPPPQAVLPPGASDDSLPFAWPAQGNLLSVFDDSKNKGVDIAGKSGDPIYASADGRVVYAGSGLRGYGNLVILKHNNTYLTAYAHNQSISVKEDQLVKRGQKIAEMGNSDSDQVKLHFEIRKSGKPVDPVKLLPPR